MTDQMQKAVAYVRVSSTAQTKRGDGLASQETRCRDFAKYQRYEIVKVFKDDKSGSMTDRPGMSALLDFLQEHRSTPHAVIIDDISRLARGMKAHIALRDSIAMAGGVLVSPSIQFGDDADSELQEYIMATVSQHQRRKNAEQTMNRMRARVKNGFYVFAKPIGYQYKKTVDRGKVLVPDEPFASILTEALEGFANGRFGSQVEVKRFLEAQPAWPKDLPNGEIRNQRVKDILTRSVYAGYVEAPTWGIPLRKGQHEGLISFETYQKIQDRLATPNRAMARKDISADFPLRGFVECADCGNPLTANWSKSKTGKKHPYYMCFTKGCKSHRKSIRRDVIEGEVAEALKALQPTEGLFALTRAMMKVAWDHRAAQAKAGMATLKQDVKATQKKIDTLLDRIVEASTPSVVAAYEKRIANLEREKLIKEEKLEKGPMSPRSFEDVFELTCGFLANPWNLWESGQIALRRTVLKLAFGQRLSYSRETGLRTPKTALPFKYLARVSMGESEVARWGGFTHNLWQISISPHIGHFSLISVGYSAYRLRVPHSNLGRTTTIRPRNRPRNEAKKHRDAPPQGLAATRYSEGRNERWRRSVVQARECKQRALVLPNPSKGHAAQDRVGCLSGGIVTTRSRARR